MTQPTIFQPHVRRMIDESRTLESNIDKLDAFIAKEQQARTMGVGTSLVPNPTDYNAMIDQLAGMQAYATSLSRRLVRELLKRTVLE